MLPLILVASSLIVIGTIGTGVYYYEQENNADIKRMASEEVRSWTTVPTINQNVNAERPWNMFNEEHNVDNEEHNVEREFQERLLGLRDELFRSIDTLFANNQQDDFLGIAGIQELFGKVQLDGIDALKRIIQNVVAFDQGVYSSLDSLVDLFGNYGLDKLNKMNVNDLRNQDLVTFVRSFRNVLNSIFGKILGNVDDFTVKFYNPDMHYDYEALASMFIFDVARGLGTKDAGGISVRDFVDFLRSDIASPFLGDKRNQVMECLDDFAFVVPLCIVSTFAPYVTRAGFRGLLGQVIAEIILKNSETLDVYKNIFGDVRKILGTVASKTAEDFGQPAEQFANFVKFSRYYLSFIPILDSFVIDMDDGQNAEFNGYHEALTAEAIAECKKSMGLDPNIKYNKRDIKLQFKLLARTVHPDKHHPEEKAEWEEKFKVILDAHTRLINLVGNDYDLV